MTMDEVQRRGRTRALSLAGEVRVWFRIGRGPGKAFVGRIVGVYPCGAVVEGTPAVAWGTVMGPPVAYRLWVGFADLHCGHATLAAADAVLPTLAAAGGS